MRLVASTPVFTNRIVPLTSFSFSVALAALIAPSGCASEKNKEASKDASSVELLNVSYDPTRELYTDINAAFAKSYKDKTNVSVTVKQSHGGSGKQARSVIDGLEADVVSLALAGDIDALANAQLLDKNWQARFKDHSAPYTSTIVFVVRTGNPKAIKDWDDLVKPGTQVITPNPKTSGGARWAYLAAWGYAKQKLGDDPHAQEFVKQLYKNVPVLDTGARGSTTTFVERGIGDVLLSWENEAYLASEQAGKGKLEIIVPPRSILAEPPVAIVDKIAAKHNTTEVAKAYLEFLSSDEGQAIIAKHHYRPRSEKAAALSPLPKLELFTIEDLGGWTQAQATHFADGGTFDAIYAK